MVMKSSNIVKVNPKMLNISPFASKSIKYGVFGVSRSMPLTP